MAIQGKNSRVAWLAEAQRRREIRLTMRKTLLDVAEQVIVDESLVYRWESGERTPTPEQAKAWMEGLRALEGAQREAMSAVSMGEDGPPPVLPEKPVRRGRTGER